MLGYVRLGWGWVVPQAQKLAQTPYYGMVQAWSYRISLFPLILWFLDFTYPEPTFWLHLSLPKLLTDASGSVVTVRSLLLYWYHFEINMDIYTLMLTSLVISYHHLIQSLSVRNFIKFHPSDQNLKRSKLELPYCTT